MSHLPVWIKIRAREINPGDLIQIDDGRVLPVDRVYGPPQAKFKVLLCCGPERLLYKLDEMIPALLEDTGEQAA